jgi:hypothetical protein
VEAAGIAPASRIPQLQSLHESCVEQGCQWLRHGCADLALSELLAKWPALPAHITQAIMALVRTSVG